MLTARTRLRLDCRLQRANLAASGRASFSRLRFRRCHDRAGRSGCEIQSGLRGAKIDNLVVRTVAKPALPAIFSGINAKRKCVSIYKYIFFPEGGGGEAALMSHERGAVHCPLVLKMPPSRAVICVCLLLIIHSSLHTMRGLSLPLSLSLRCAAS